MDAQSSMVWVCIFVLVLGLFIMYGGLGSCFELQKMKNIKKERRKIKG